MTTILQVRVGSESHAIDLDSLVPVWSPGNAACDVWVAIRALGASGYFCEVEVSNASATFGGKGRPMLDGPIAITVEAPAGFELLDPYALPWPDLWPVQRCTFRRYGIVPAGISADDRRRVIEYVMGKIRSGFDAAHFGPANLPLPRTAPNTQTADRAAFDAFVLALHNPSMTWHYGSEWLNGLVAGVAGGDHGVPMPIRAHGWCPFGASDPGDVAGAGIEFSQGWQQNQNLARVALLASMCCADRTWVQYRRDSGRPFSADDYGAQTPSYAPGGSDPNNNRLPEFKGLYNPDPLPAEFDPAHSIRETGWWIAAYELTGSPAVARLLIGQAEEARIVYSDKGPTNFSGGWTPANLAQWVAWFDGAASRIGRGYPGSIFGREIGWPCWTIAMALKIDPTNVGLRNLATLMVETAKRASMDANGICQRMHSEPLWNDATHDACQAFEVPIFWHGLYALSVQLGLAAPPDTLTAGHSLYDPSPQPGNGPFHFTYVSSAGGGTILPAPLLLGKGADASSPAGDPAHTEAMLALCYQISGDPYWLQRSARFGGVATATYQDKATLFRSRVDLMGWGANLLAQYEKVGA